MLAYFLYSNTLVEHLLGKLPVAVNFGQFWINRKGVNGWGGYSGLLGYHLQLPKEGYRGLLGYWTAYSGPLHYRLRDPKISLLHG